jgi:uncharacterized membrane protein
MSNIIARIGSALNDQLDSLFPNNAGKEPSKRPFFPMDYAQNSAVTADKRGYIRIIDGDSLINSAKKHDVVVKLETQYGNFITENAIFLTIYSKEILDDSVYKKFKGCICCG